MESLAPVRRWLFVLWALVFLMVAIGGITRLTGSGLSIVEWRPVTGALPPLGDAAWQAAFDAYKGSPQFRAVNSWMALDDFKRIFFWEYVHRLVGRLIGFACLVPWLWFVWTRRLTGALRWRTGSLFLLGGLQGAVGWYMVKSGLLHEPRVSHFRLALHLLLAIAVGMWTLWQALDLRVASSIPAKQPAAFPVSLAQRRHAVSFLVLLGLQLAYGAFMAGTHAGHLFATFPDMNGHYLPGAFLGNDSFGSALFVNPAGIHYVHRVLGALLLGYALWLAFWLRADPRLGLLARALAALAVVQATLGALSVVLHMPLVLAALHQLVAYVLCSVAVALCHAAFVSRSHAVESRDRDGGLAGAGQDLRST